MGQFSTGKGHFYDENVNLYKNLARGTTWISSLSCEGSIDDNIIILPFILPLNFKILEISIFSVIFSL